MTRFAIADAILRENHKYTRQRDGRREKKNAYFKNNKSPFKCKKWHYMSGKITVSDACATPRNVRPHKIRRAATPVFAPLQL